MDRVFVEKKPEFNTEARHLLHDLRSSLDLDGLDEVRVIQRYDVEGLTPAEFEAATRLVLSEPQVDTASPELSLAPGEEAFAVEYLPGQFDQRADSAAQCVQILTGGRRPPVASARVIALRGALTGPGIGRVKEYVINAVDSREASMGLPATLEVRAAPPAEVAVLDGFGACDAAGLDALRGTLGLAMAPADLAFCQRYFRDEEGRDPTITEIRLLDTYWSDHCRHTTFHAALESVVIDPGAEAVAESYELYRTSRSAVHGPEAPPVTLMDIALMGMRELRRTGELDNLEVSREVNAASIIVPVAVRHDRATEGIERKGDTEGASHPDRGAESTTEEWLVMFKNETHNHPTEIEPFGGAATCLGGAIRDPLSGRAYVYQAMRVTGAGDPRAPFSETLPGKLPQRKICQVAAHGYSSYGNQIGLATGQVSEIYHPGYIAKRMEIGAVVAAVPRAHVTRGEPAPGDVVLLIGGRTGRDGIGGATGSSKGHTQTALENSAEVQKGDPPTERKIQRLFRNPDLARRIKVCNDFGAGGVSVAVGEIAGSLEIDLDRVPKKYEGLDGTELAISESQERMAVLVDPSEVGRFVAESDKENLECTPIATVADHGRLVMRWRGKTIVNLSRAFLDTHGVRQSARVRVAAPDPDGCPLGRPLPVVEAADGLGDRMRALLSDLNLCSRKGLGEMFDSSIGAGTVLNPFGGAAQLTPPDAMAAKIPLVDGETDACTLMSWGFNPRLALWSPYHAALYAVTESVCRIVAAGGPLPEIRLTLQEYFEKLRDDPVRWGKPFSALLGAYHAQHGLRLAAVGGKDSMSGTFEDLDVPPTLVSFAVAPSLASRALSPEFKRPGSGVFFVAVPRDARQRPDFAALKAIAAALDDLNRGGHLLALHSLGEGGIAAGLATMCFGNHIGFEEASREDAPCLFRERYGAFLLETATPDAVREALPDAQHLGCTGSVPRVTIAGRSFALSELLAWWSAPLEEVYPTRATTLHPAVETYSHSGRAPLRSPRSDRAKPLVLIPVFPGTNCEYDTARAFREAGAEVEIAIFRNLSAAAVDESLRGLAERLDRAQILMLAGGFSAGDEPDGSGKFIAAVLRNPLVSEAAMRLVRDRDGLILGICNGFQALVKTGLLPYGEIRNPEPDSPTLTFNDLGRHAACYVTTRVASTLTPWMAHCEVGELHRLPVSHGEGKFFAGSEEIRALGAAGQIVTQYTTPDGVPSMGIAHNPNGSLHAIEGLCSADGRVFGKMAHSERHGRGVARNIPGNKHQPLFRAGIEYFR